MHTSHAGVGSGAASQRPKNLFSLTKSATIQMQLERGTIRRHEFSLAISAKCTQIGHPSGSLAAQPLKSGK
jgi:hypothetical protein